MKRLHFLFLIFDDPGFQKIIAYLRSKDLDFNYEVADRKPKLLKNLRERNWDLIFLDEKVPGFRLDEVLRTLVTESPDIPVIVIVDKLTEDVAARSLKGGAADIIIKHNMSRFLPAIQHCLEPNAKFGGGYARILLEKYDYIINASKSFLSLINRDFTYAAINDTLRKAHNLNRNEILGKPLAEIWGKQKFNHSIKDHLVRCFNGETVQYKAWFDTPSLGYRYYEVTFAPYHDRNGEVIHAMVETKDITREKEMEDRIMESESEVVSIIENSSDFFWSVNRDFNVLFANKLFKDAFFEFYGIHLNKGVNIIDALPANEKNLWKKNYDKGLKGEHFSFEHSYLLEEHILYFEVTINPIANENQKTIGVSCIAKDVSEKKFREDQIRRQSEDLHLVNRLNNAVNSGLDLQKILRQLNRESKKIFGGLGAVIYLTNENRTSLSPAYLPFRKKWMYELESTSGLKIKDLNIPLRPGQHYYKVLDHGQPVMADTPAMVEAVYRNFIPPEYHKKFIPLTVKFLGLKSIYTLPLITKSQPIGVMDISRKTYFLETELQRIRLLAEQVTLILKRKLDEELLMTNEKRFRLLFESANDGIFIMRHETFLDCNEKTLELFRCKKEDILGRTPFDFSPEFQPGGESSEQLAFKKLRLAEKGNSLRFDWKHKRLDGSEFFTEVSLNPIKIGDQKLIQAIVRDISIRKESEALLRESEERFRALFEDAPDAIFLADPESGHILDANLAACELVRYKKEDLIGKHFTMLHPPDSHSLAKFSFQQDHYRQGTDTDGEIFILRSDGSTVPVEIQSRLIKIGGREVNQGAFRDISERYRARKELLQQEEILRETQRIAHLGSLEMDVNTRTSKWSDETFHILGYDPHTVEASYENFKKSVHPEDWPTVESQLNTALTRLEDFESEFRIIRPSGEERHILSKAEVKLNEEGQPQELIGSLHDLTEIRMVEKALMQSEEKFRTLFMEGHFPTFLIESGNPDILQPNKAFIKLLGYSQKELNALDIGKLTHPDDREAMQNVLGQLRSGKKDTFQLEKRFVCKDGTVIWGQTGGATIKNMDGSIAGIIIMIIDITRQKIAEKEIRERTSDLTLINDLNLQANSNLDLENILAFFSEQIYNQFHNASFRLMLWDEGKEQFIFRHIQISKNIRSDLEKILGRSIQNHVYKPKRGSYFWTRFKNRKPWLETDHGSIQRQISSIMNIRSKNGRQKEVIQLLGIRSIMNFPLIIGEEIMGNAMFISAEHIDEHTMERLTRIMEQFSGILRRKLVEEEESKLFTVVEQLTETVIITDTDGIIQYTNPAFEVSTGFSRKGSVGKTLSMIRSGKQNVSFYRKLWQTIESGKSWSGIMVNKKIDGSLFHEEVTITPIKDERGNIVNYVAVKRDITKEKMLEAQLIQAQKLETVGTLAGGIAHDFNNILGTLLGYNEMVIEEVPEGSSAREYLLQMRSAMNRAKSLVNKILTFSRKMEPEMKVVSMMQIVEESLAMFRSIKAKNVVIHQKMCSDCQPILVDPSQMQQVIMNLLTNANQVLKENGGTIGVGLDIIENDEDLKNLHPMLVSDRLMKLTIKDDGPGMEQDVRERIFEPFYTTKPVGEGTGLGLSVVHGIIMSHNGVIEVDSQPGKGTEISIYLQFNNP